MCGNELPKQKSGNAGEVLAEFVAPAAIFNGTNVLALPLGELILL